MTSVQAKPKFPPPPDSNITRVGDSIVYNGIAMDIRIFGSRNSPAEVIDYYRRIWPEGDENNPGYSVTNALQPWQIITYVKNGYLMTVQVQPAKNSKGSTGYLGLSRMPELDRGPPELGSGFPKMRGSYVANDIQSKDLVKKGRTIILMNRASVRTNANFYRDHYLNQGWTAEMDREISGGNVHTLRFRKGDKNVSIVINKGDKTIVTAQINKEGLF
ncbi:MAG: hypothetical protein R3318_04690 [Gammaproteobacteria bacterium]|nr:hypothetical protein [Gammaproteobacteria bacterium]